MSSHGHSVKRNGRIQWKGQKAEAQVSPEDDWRCIHALGSGDKRLHHFSICGPLCCWGAGSRPRVGIKCRCRGSPSVPGWGGRGQPWRGPEWCTRECACAHLCVGAVHVMLSTVYYSYIHRNKNVARGGGREIQEGRDIRNLRVIQVDVWQKSSDTAQNYL